MTRLTGSPKSRIHAVGRLSRLVVVMTCLTLISCATRQRAVTASAPNWPSRPNLTRIVQTGVVRFAADLEIGTGFWSTLWRSVIGGGQESIGHPYGIHADARKRVLVVDSQKRGVHLFDREAGSYFLIGAAERVFTLPIDITEDLDNVAYVTDAAAGTVFRIDLADRHPVMFVGGLKRPTGIVFNPTNRLIYVTDTLAGQIVAFDRLGREVLRFGRPGQGRDELNRPTDLAVDAQGRIYVTDSINARIQIFSWEGKFVSGFGEAGDSAGYFSKAKGVAVNSEGQIFVCDAMHDMVQVFDQKGRLLLNFGSTGSGDGEFWMPSGIAIDKDDNVYVADTYNNRVQIFGYVGSGQ